MERYDQKKNENWISHCIFKSYAEGFRVFFIHARALIFPLNALYLPTKHPVVAKFLILTSPIYQNRLLLSLSYLGTKASKPFFHKTFPGTSKKISHCAKFQSSSCLISDANVSC